MAEYDSFKVSSERALEGRHRKFYKIPDIEGTRHLDIGWIDSDWPITGATLGVDPGSSQVDWTYVPTKEEMAYHRSVTKRIGFEEVAASGGDLPFRDGTIDSVSSQFAMGESFDLQEGLEESIRVLRSGGKLAVLASLAPEHIREIKIWLRQQPIRNVRIRIREKDIETDDLWQGRSNEDGYPEGSPAHLYGIEFTRI